MEMDDVASAPPKQQPAKKPLRRKSKKASNWDRIKHSFIQRTNGITQHFRMRERTSGRIALFVLLVLVAYGVGIYYAAKEFGWFGFITLHSASADGDLEAIRAIVYDSNESIDFSVRDIWGKTPLHYACENGHDAIVKVLLGYGASSILTTQEDRTPLQLALRGRHSKVVGVLLGHGVDPEWRFTDVSFGGGGALAFAAMTGDIESMEILLKHGAQPDSVTHSGVTALIYAAARGDKDAVALLVAYGADVNMADDNGVTPFLYGSAAKTPDALQILLNAGADIYAKDNLGVTSLMVASSAGSKEVVTLILDNWWRRSLNAKSKNGGRTALMNAVLRKDVEIVQLLLDAGAKLVVKDMAGKTAIDLAPTEELELLLRTTLETDRWDEVEDEEEDEEEEEGEDEEGWDEEEEEGRWIEEDDEDDDDIEDEEDEWLDGVDSAGVTAAAGVSRSGGEL